MHTQSQLLSRVWWESEAKDGHRGDEEAGHDQVGEVVEGSPPDGRGNGRKVKTKSGNGFTLVTFDERVYTKMVTRFTFRGYVVALMAKEISFVRKGLHTNPRKILTTSSSLSSLSSS